MDKRICAEVPGLDIVVGGHTNTFLYTGKEPTSQKAEGPYPTPVKNVEGHHCLVVQDYAYGKYLGFLQVSFDDQVAIGCKLTYKIIPIGFYILIMNFWIYFRVNLCPGPVTLFWLTILCLKIPKWTPLWRSISRKSPLSGWKLLAKLQPVWMGCVKGLKFTRYFTFIDSITFFSYFRCRVQECTYGNLITDAMVYSYLKKRSETLQSGDTGGTTPSGWSPSAIALLNSGLFCVLQKFTYRIYCPSIVQFIVKFINDFLWVLKRFNRLNVMFLFAVNLLMFLHVYIS